MKNKYLNIIKQNMLMTSELKTLLKIFENEGIAVIAFKGPLLSQLAFGDVISRQYLDLDILVQKKDLNKIFSILRKNGYEEHYNLQEYQKEMIKNVIHDVSFVKKDMKISLEVHWILSSGEFFVDLEKLNYFQSLDRVKIDSNFSANSLKKEIVLIYLCIHGYKHLWERIEWLVDIVHFLEKQEINFIEVLQLSKQINAHKIVLSTLILCKNIFDIKISDEVLYEISKNRNLENKSLRFIEDLLDLETLTKRSNHNRKLSYMQFYLLDHKISKIKYLLSFILPTQQDYLSIKLPKYLRFLYFIIRPINIFIRAFK